MRISSLFFPVLFFGSLSVSAQDVTDAYKLSNLTVQGSARSMGFGNALGSVGGDFSSVSVNPAGLGIYRSSEMSFTPSLKINAATADYAGSSASDNNTRFGINHFALVFTNAPKGQRYDKRDWKTVSFAFGMNRVADFNRNYTYAGRNNTSSVSQAFESDANMYPDDAISSAASNGFGSIGYWSYVVNQDANNKYFYSVVPFQGGINQMKNVKERGAINEYVISLGGNYKEKLMLGMTIGLPSVRYKRTTSYSETIADNNPNNLYNFSSFTYGQKLDITGNGINAKLGAIYKFSNLFRAGIAFHTPTYYAINDVWDPTVTARVQGQNILMNSTDGMLRNEFNYTVSTPWKGVLSATFMIGKLGFITADYEYVDYSSTRYHYSDGEDAATTITIQQNENAMNNEIKKTYKGVSNFRVGAEGRLGKYFMVRAGFGYYGDPYTMYGKAIMPYSYTTERTDVSVGMGFRFEHFFTDIAFVHSSYQGFEQPYSVAYTDANGVKAVYSGNPASVPISTISYALNNVAWTVGVKF